jgi:alkylation response protein AidB-like acyl-CoA dehydrogenase
LDEALAYAKKRIAFGKPISEFQAIQFKLADMATQLEASRLLVYEAAARADLGDEQIAKLASMAKVFATEALQYIVDEALQIHGGIGLAKGMIVERLYRAAKSLLIYEGTSEIQRIVIARRLLQAG